MLTNRGKKVFLKEKTNIMSRGNVQIFVDLMYNKANIDSFHLTTANARNDDGE